jgi:hypothetical protein
MTRPSKKKHEKRLVRTENIVSRPESAANAFVGVGGVSPKGAESLIAF